MNEADNPSTALARAVLTMLVEAGISEVVVAPGSRNAPLSFAADVLAANGEITLHTRIDERSAAFLALGLTKGGRRAAVMCTSGTAVANLHPALLEAAHSGVPVVAVTADRPATLRETNANQTTDQVGIFGALIATHDIDEAEDFEDRTIADEIWQASGPFHLNVQFAEPLTPSDEWQAEPIAVRPTIQRPEPRLFEIINQGPRTVVVAGDGAGPAARVLAEAAGWPLLAEPSSGARSGDHAIRSYRLLLGTDLGHRVERVVVFGHVTLSRPVLRLPQRGDVDVVATRATGVWPTPPYEVDRYVRTALQVHGQADTEWLNEWRTADHALSKKVDALIARTKELTAYDVARAVAAHVEADDLLVVGPSNPVRDLDLMAGPIEGTVLANRGLAGIDGVVSTAIGAATATGARAIAFMGDVTFLHDSNGLILGPDEERPDLTIVVVNDDGGSIFATLEQGAEEFADHFERLFGTPHHVDLAALCAATRTPHLKVTSAIELEQALANPNGGIEVIEAVVRRDNRRELDQAIRSL